MKTSQQTPQTEDFSFEAATGLKPSQTASLTAQLTTELGIEKELAKLPPMPKLFLDALQKLGESSLAERKKWGTSPNTLASGQPYLSFPLPADAIAARLHFYNTFRYIQRPRNTHHFPTLSVALRGLKMAVRDTMLIFYIAKPPAVWPTGILIIGGGPNLNQAPNDPSNESGSTK